MRVLEANSINTPRGLGFVDLNPNDGEPYAILSHTWGKGEVLFSHVVDGTAASMAAYSKIVYACQQALEDGYKYVWVDTCCIEKSSSAELGEAINSMFRWYKEAAVCYAYLADYGDGADSFEASRWFTRGWTLQELIAPKDVVFYGANWLEIGTKRSLKSAISRLTRIGEHILTGDRPVETASIASRMGWASDRVTTRPEDVAYCLLGIFDVNMPLLYGEGTKAFLRLQEELLRKTDDHTLFAWLDEEAPEDKQYGLLAPSPRCFAHTRHLIPYGGSARESGWSPITMSNMGVSIELRVMHLRGTLYAAFIDCPSLDFDIDLPYLFLYMRSTAPPLEHFARVRAGQFGKSHLAQARSRQIIVSPEVQGELGADKVYIHHGIYFQPGPPRELYRVVDAAHYPSGTKVKVDPAEKWGDWLRVPIDRRPYRITAAILFARPKDGKAVLVSFGSCDAVRLGFHAFEWGDGGLEIPEAKVMQATFNPTLFGGTIELPNHVVRVASKNEVLDRVKLYGTKIDIQPKWSSEQAVLRMTDAASQETQNVANSEEPDPAILKAKGKGKSEKGTLKKLFTFRKG